MRLNFPGTKLSRFSRFGIFQALVKNGRRTVPRAPISGRQLNRVWLLFEQIQYACTCHDVTSKPFFCPTNPPRITKQSLLVSCATCHRLPPPPGKGCRTAQLPGGPVHLLPQRVVVY